MGAERVELDLKVAKHLDEPLSTGSRRSSSRLVEVAVLAVWEFAADSVTVAGRVEVGTGVEATVMSYRCRH